MSDATGMVIRRLIVLGTGGETYSLRPFREGLPVSVIAVHADAFDHCQSHIDRLRSSTSWAEVSNAYDVLLRMSLRPVNDDNEKAAQAVVREYVQYIQTYISQMRRGEYGFTPEETAMMERWGAQLRQKTTADPFQDEEEDNMEDVD